MKLAKNDFIQRKMVQIANAPAMYVGKAADKFESLSIEKQCRTVLSLVKVSQAAFQNPRRILMDGWRNDYKAANTQSPLTPEKWLEPFLAEPLFHKILKKIKTTPETVLARLKEA